MNNGSKVAKFVESDSVIYIAVGDIIGTSLGFGEPETKQLGIKSPFTILITSDIVV